jgi:hypothetical protein
MYSFVPNALLYVATATGLGFKGWGLGFLV